MYAYCLAVCEDDQVVREEICRFCHEVLDENEISHQITAFSSAEELEEAMETRAQSFHLLILDIKMKGKSGMELAMELRNRDEETSILFITGYDEYIEQGYEVQAVQFLVKPLIWEKLRTALLKDWRRKHLPKTLILQKGRQSLQLPIDKILYAETDGRHGVRIFLEDGEERFSASLTEMENAASGQMVRCHNSYLVNVQHARRIDRQTFILDDGQRLPISRKYLVQCQEKLVSLVNR
ncbi:MAG TPA: response regulator transcription factor [Candidatus Limivivens intestinipullorum]|uniref:Stage 0 sporulation protein A homolog n=1 Tax=Candidatus Limivivens intestinipullorum TaxID=2840858 RepID=A0A9D1JKY8_9FIRM|nr:response regulator transcription factor [Candidatus Limivivens intestinipullorum]